MKPFIRWAGSKKQLLQTLAAYWSHSFQRYIEPFAGSACLYFHLEPRTAILGDMNSELILALRAIRLDVDRVLECYRRLPRTATSFYRIRTAETASLSIFEAAARFLYLNSLCFNGLYRTNSEGRFNVPYCPPGHATMKEDHIRQAASLLSRATLMNDDFEATASLATRGDFVYMDPPYALSARRVFSEYGPNPFCVKDLERLSRLLERLDANGVKFLVSYADCKEGRTAFEPWHRRRVWTRRNIAGFTGDRRGSYELIATNIDDRVANA